MSVKNEIIDFCKSIADDPLIVQGAGGNVSWKDGEVLWVKASGTWLADAGEQEIFVPVDRSGLRASLDNDDFNVIPTSIAGSALRPSIETLLHALMPHQVVVHLHPVDILAWMVNDYIVKDSERLFQFASLGSLIPYRKPGAELAMEVARNLLLHPDTNCLFLQNHGVVFGGSTINEVHQQMRDVLSQMRLKVVFPSCSREILRTFPQECGSLFTLLDDLEIQAFALDDTLFERLAYAWALCPDHVVFLGGKAVCFESMNEFVEQLSKSNAVPNLVFVRGVGVYVTENFNKTQRIQLRFYYDVLIRIPQNWKLVTLTENNVHDLLFWEAEKYRVSMKKIDPAISSKNN
jgi:rhamnose utilization protein RhaD (predicted bifunctional aldolase and dehydrogenase)